MNNDILKLIADNPTLFEALKEVMLKQFNLDSLSPTLADEPLGQMVRARLIGLRGVEDGLKEILTHKTVPKLEEAENPAR